MGVRVAIQFNPLRTAHLIRAQVRLSLRPWAHADGRPHLAAAAAAPAPAPEVRGACVVLVLCVFVHYRVGHAIDPVSEIRARTHATAGRLEVVGRAEVDVGDGAGAEGVRVVGPPLVRPVYGALWVIKVWCEGRYFGEASKPGAGVGLPDERRVRQRGAGRDGVDERVCARLKIQKSSEPTPPNHQPPNPNAPPATCVPFPSAPPAPVPVPAAGPISSRTAWRVARWTAPAKCGAWPHCAVVVVQGGERCHR